MKKLIYLPAVALIASLFGCAVDVDIPEIKFSNEATWTGRTLQNVRYYDTTVDTIAQAAVEAAKAQGLFFVGENPNSRGGTELIFRGDLDIKVTIDIDVRKPSQRDSSAPSYVEVQIVYGTWGDLEKSQKLVSGITQNL